MKRFIVTIVILSLLLGSQSLAANSNYQGSFMPSDPESNSSTPPKFPIYEAENPVSTLTTPDHPDALHIECAISDFDTGAEYSLNDFTIEDGYCYHLVLQFYSTGGSIKDLEIVAAYLDSSTSALRFTIRDKIDEQTLATVRVIPTLPAKSSDLKLTYRESSGKKCYAGVLLGLTHSEIKDLFDPQTGLELSTVLSANDYETRGTAPESLILDFDAHAPEPKPAEIPASSNLIRGLACFAFGIIVSVMIVRLVRWRKSLH